MSKSKRQSRNGGYGGGAKKIASLIIILLLALGYGAHDQLEGLLPGGVEDVDVSTRSTAQIADAVPEFDDDPYVTINGNEPFFTEEDIKESEERGSYEEYSKLDRYGRPGVCIANVGEDLMPTDDRESIRDIKPPGWHKVFYDDVVPGENAYNRCHLIAYCLTGENANRRNLITGTRFLNVEGMLPFEEEAARYIERTGHHILYMVTPIYNGSDLVAEGVLMEAQSIEDDEISWCVYCYNEQPGLVIDHHTGAATHE